MIRHHPGIADVQKRAKIPETAREGGMPLQWVAWAKSWGRCDSVEGGRRGRRIRSRIEAPSGLVVTLSDWRWPGKGESFACEGFCWAGLDGPPRKLQSRAGVEGIDWLAGWAATGLRKLGEKRSRHALVVRRSPALPFLSPQDTNVEPCPYVKSSLGECLCNHLTLQKGSR